VHVEGRFLGLLVRPILDLLQPGQEGAVTEAHPRSLGVPEGDDDEGSVGGSGDMGELSRRQPLAAVGVYHFDRILVLLDSCALELVDRADVAAMTLPFLFRSSRAKVSVAGRGCSAKRALTLDVVRALDTGWAAPGGLPALARCLEPDGYTTRTGIPD
jgi:hypothetical protein